MDVFELRRSLVHDYEEFTRSFVSVRDERIKEYVDQEFAQGLLWPEPLVQLNPTFEPGASVEELVEQGILHADCARIFRRKKDADDFGTALRLHRHQADAINLASKGSNFVMTTGTGSGKSLGYIIPIVDRVLREGAGKGIRAIVVYPMNALANSQEKELEKFIEWGYPGGQGQVTFKRYTGQEKDPERQAIMASPPDILLTNYAMLELILTRPEESRLVESAKLLRFLVLDEFHTYRGRQGADVALLVRRLRQASGASDVQHIGTSATLATGGTFAQQQTEIARVASTLFGSPLAPSEVVGETLQRATAEVDMNADLVVRLKVRLGTSSPEALGEFLEDPLARWIESTFGLRSSADSGRLVRAQPRTIRAAAEELESLTGVDVSKCRDAIIETLMAGAALRREDAPYPIFAFRLHQFFSRGDTVYAGLGQEGNRYITTQGQQFVPDDREKILLPLAFCRDCGQEYYVVERRESRGAVRFAPREIWDRGSDDERGVGYLYASTQQPWPEQPEAIADQVPDEWTEVLPDQRVRVLPARRKDLPERVIVGTDGSTEGPNPITAHYIRSPLRFCLRCGVSYAGRQTSDLGKLSTLGSGGRSSATSLLAFSTVRTLRRDKSVVSEARKLLSFTDNRQDASLQAGHFNDFVELGLIRSALYRAAREAGASGLAHDEVAGKTAAMLALPFELYARDPNVRYQAREETDRALREAIGYRLYRDLERGWRVTSPNLEQCGLLEIRYSSLDDLVTDEEVWSSLTPPLAKATKAQRRLAAHVLLDHLRRELAIFVEYLRESWQEGLKQRSSQRLTPPWAIDEDERLTFAAVAYPRPRRKDEDFRGHVYLSARGGVGLFLRRQGILADIGKRLRLDDIQKVIEDLLRALQVGGLVTIVDEPRGANLVPGYQLTAGALRWCAGDGTAAYRDPVRVPRAPEGGSRPNRFFVDFYQSAGAQGQGLQAREHTAQVPADEREKREGDFGTARLPVLFCSPTMELGVDIRELNVVNMRNVPPTPANYAQRSGRAGRGGTPALVSTYSAAGSPHDQYFFRRPELMVAGQVRPPRLDLLNEDLVRSHVHALWLSETKLELGPSLTRVLDIDGAAPTLALRESVRNVIDDGGVRERSRAAAQSFVASIEGIGLAEWYSPEWVSEVIASVGLSFDAACERWRTLYRAAVESRDRQNLLIADAAASVQSRQRATHIRAEAEAQLELLRGDRDTDRVRGDFYSYRYFASEGFLPGYSFPRLPLSAFIPGRAGAPKSDQFLSRPRFVAISEFGPGSTVYHEGSRYRINKVILPPNRTEDNRLITQTAKQCGACGYLHLVDSGVPAPDLCEHCGERLTAPLEGLFRLQNVSTRRRERINSDEENRQRAGFEVRSGLRFAMRGGATDIKRAQIQTPEGAWDLLYGSAATIWRINVGRRRRADPSRLGYVLDTERGYWGKDDDDPDDPGDPMGQQQQRVIPYVEDRRNALTLRPPTQLSAEQMASLAAALKSAIQLNFELEDQELAVEPLPSDGDRRLLLLYEASEGGAGVLRRLVTEPGAFASVARRALDLCHFDPDTAIDLEHAPHARETCEAACYDCLLSYYNQRDHELLDRKQIRDVLLELARSEAAVSPSSLTRADLRAALIARTASALERRWLSVVDESGRALPNAAGKVIEGARARPDFSYDQHQAAVFIDGPVHAYPDVASRDAAAAARLEELGYLVIRFAHDGDWDAVFARYPTVFGHAR